MTRLPLLACTITIWYLVALRGGIAQTSIEIDSPPFVLVPDECSFAAPPAAAAASASREILLKILLVEFEDVRCAKREDGETPRYSARDFENLLSSDGDYVTPRALSPDGEEVYGSMNDYFRAMSGDRLRLRASVVNPLGPDSVTPVWVRLNQTKSGYHEKLLFDCPIFHDAMQAARDRGIDISTSSDVRLVIIYAGNLYLGGGGLNPNAAERAYIMSEVQGRPYGQEHGAATFSRIGLHCHEFAHTIGIGHTSGSRADLMESGSRNGSVEGNAPAPLNAIDRAGMGWAECIEAGLGDTGAVDLGYSLRSPTIYRMKNQKGDDFFVENRRFDCTMRLGDTEVPDYNNAAFFPPAWPHGTITQGILVWRSNTVCDWSNPEYSRRGLLYASGRYGRTYPENMPSETDDGVPFPGVSGVKLLSPWSDPRNPYTWEPDYFDSSRHHYTLHVPNTKGGSLGGFEILSEDAVHGTFQVIFRVAQPSNPSASNRSTTQTATAHNSQRKLFREPGGTMHMVFESGGEIFYRRSLTEGKTWAGVQQVSNGNGGNAYPCVTVCGGTVLVAWQIQAKALHCYTIHAARSLDGGISWRPPGCVAQVLNCATPGPVPTVVGSSTGRAVVLFRDGQGVCGRISRDEGMSWSASPPFPGSTGSWGTPSSAMALTGDGTLLAHVACAGRTGNGDSKIYHDALDVEAGTWTGESVLSDVLPPEYADSRNPSIAASCGGQSRTPTIHVAWEASDIATGNGGVIIHRAARGGTFAPSYSVLDNGSMHSPSVASTGGESALLLCQRNPARELWRLIYDGQTWRGESQPYAVGGCDPQASTGSDTIVSLWTSGEAAPFRIEVRGENTHVEQPSACWRYARSISMTDPARSAALQASLGSCTVIRNGGTRNDLALCSEEPSDSVCAAASALALMRTAPFRLDGSIDSLQVEFSFSGQARGQLFSSDLGSVAFQLVRHGTGDVLGTFARHHGSDIQETPEGITRMSLPLARFRGQELDSCFIRLCLEGFCGESVSATLGRVYSRGCNRAVTACYGCFEEWPTTADDTGPAPLKAVLHQNYPNPFNVRTTIRYDLPFEGDVRIEVYNAIGQRVATPVDCVQKRGLHDAIFDASGLASGVYFCRMLFKPASPSQNRSDPSNSESIAQTRLILLK